MIRGTYILVFKVAVQYLLQSYVGFQLKKKKNDNTKQNPSRIAAGTVQQPVHFVLRCRFTVLQLNSSSLREYY